MLYVVIGVIVLVVIIGFIYNYKRSRRGSLPHQGS